MTTKIRTADRRPDRPLHKRKEGVGRRAARRSARVTKRSGRDDDAARHRHDEGRNIQPDHPDRIERADAGAEDENRGYHDPFRSEGAVPGGREDAAQRDHRGDRKVEAANQDDEALTESHNDQERGQSDDRIDLIPRPERRAHEPRREDEDDREGENRRGADRLRANAPDPPRIRGRLQGGGGSRAAHARAPVEARREMTDPNTMASTMTAPWKMPV